MEKEFDIWNSDSREVICVRNDPNSDLLEIGKRYTVNGVIIHPWYKEVRLKEFPDHRFNVFCFEEVE